MRGDFDEDELDDDTDFYERRDVSTDAQGQVEPHGETVADLAPMIDEQARWQSRVDELEEEAASLRAENERLRQELQQRDYCAACDREGATAGGDTTLSEFHACSGLLCGHHWSLRRESDQINPQTGDLDEWCDYCALERDGKAVADERDEVQRDAEAWHSYYDSANVARRKAEDALASFTAQQAQMREALTLANELPFCDGSDCCAGQHPQRLCLGCEELWARFRAASAAALSTPEPVAGDPK